MPFVKCISATYLVGVARQHYPIEADHLYPPLFGLALTGSVYRNVRASQESTCPSILRDGHLDLSVFYRGDHIPVQVGAKHFGPNGFKPPDGLRRGMPVGVVTDGDDRDLRPEPAEK
jgi:hypothetical protein